MAPQYTYGFQSAGERRRHFLKHGGRFPFATEQDYETAADTFLGGSLRPGALECVVGAGKGSKSGRVVRYDPAADEFGILSPDRRYVITFFKPTPVGKGMAYYRKQC